MPFREMLSTACGRPSLASVLPQRLMRYSHGSLGQQNLIVPVVVIVLQGVLREQQHVLPKLFWGTCREKVFVRQSGFWTVHVCYD